MGAVAAAEVAAELEALPEAERGARLGLDGHGRQPVVVEERRLASGEVVVEVEQHGELGHAVHAAPKGPGRLVVRRVGPAVLRDRVEGQARRRPRRPHETRAGPDVVAVRPEDVARARAVPVEAPPRVQALDLVGALGRAGAEPPRRLVVELLVAVAAAGVAVGEDAVREGGAAALEDGAEVEGQRHRAVALVAVVVGGRVAALLEARGLRQIDEPPAFAGRQRVPEQEGAGHAVDGRARRRRRAPVPADGRRRNAERAAGASAVRVQDPQRPQRRRRRGGRERRRRRGDLGRRGRRGAGARLLLAALLGGAAAEALRGAEPPSSLPLSLRRALQRARRPERQHRY